MRMYYHLLETALCNRYLKIKRTVKKRLSNVQNTYNFENTAKQKTYFKNPDRPTFVDLILTNFYRSFQDTCTLGTRLTDFHKLVVTFPNKNTICKPSETVKDCRMIYLNRNLIMSYQPVVYVT